MWAGSLLAPAPATSRTPAAPAAAPAPAGVLPRLRAALTSCPSGSARITTCTVALPGVSRLTRGVSTVYPRASTSSCRGALAGAGARRQACRHVSMTTRWRLCSSGSGGSTKNTTFLDPHLQRLEVGCREAVGDAAATSAVVDGRACRQLHEAQGGLVHTAGQHNKVVALVDLQHAQHVGPEGCSAVRSRNGVTGRQATSEAQVHGQDARLPAAAAAPAPHLWTCRCL